MPGRPSMFDRKTGITLLMSFVFSSGAAYCQDGPIKGSVQQTDVVSQPAYVPEYQAPQMVPTSRPVRPMPPPKPDKTPKPKPQKPVKINSSIQTSAPSPVRTPTMTTQAPVQGVLPPQFLGRWQVLGSRGNVEAQPQYQSGIDNIFSMTTSNTWNIQGSPEQGYILNTDTGVSTPLMVESQGNTAILRYQHPIKNTVAQEALVMQLGPGGAQFEGLERISIVKQGEPGPRAKVTYKLVGHRQ